MSRLLALAAAVVVLAAPAAGATKPPVVVQKDSTFGRVLFTPGHKALYYWAVEKQARRIVCTGACARLWPPLVVRSRAAVPARIPGVKGRFGVVRRPDGRLQVTYDGVALYAYAHDPPDVVLCNDVDRWFVVRV
jgi:predicted lipoprotein with Yx(FWY)xxD motif